MFYYIFVRNYVFDTFIHF